MTLPRMIRIFFAIDLPILIKEKLGSFIGTLKKKSKSHSIRWVKPENLHITLQFLPEVNAEDLPQLIQQVKAKMTRNIEKTSIHLGPLHLFPNPYWPRVIVLDISPQESLAKLAKQIGEGISSTQYPVEKRPFRGHLTLGRIKQPKGINLNFLAESEPLLPAFEGIDVNEVVLFRSEPEEDGSKYTVMEKLILH